MQKLEKKQKFRQNNNCNIGNERCKINSVKTILKFDPKIINKNDATNGLFTSI